MPLRELKKLKELLPKCADKARLAALSVVIGDIKSRIHNKGLDSNNAKIGIKTRRRGKYSKNYERARARKGRQIEYIDLQFYGDLIKSYGIGTTDDGNPAIGFKSEHQRFIAGALEEKYNTNIFSPTEQEAERATKAYIRQLRHCLEQAI